MRAPPMFEQLDHAGPPLHAIDWALKGLARVPEWPTGKRLLRQFDHVEREKDAGWPWIASATNCRARVRPC